MGENPFHLTFGREPNSIISRSGELEDIYSSFFSESPNSQVYILTGIRGSGKTVAMTTIADFYKKDDAWICVELSPENDMLEQLASKLIDEGHLRKMFIKSEFNFSFQGIGFSLKGDVPIVNVSSLLKREFEYLKRKKVKVLISVDEAVSNNHMKVFAHEFQAFLREKFDVFLLMAGLYQNISSLESSKSLTFLYRAPKIYLSSLNMVSIFNSYKRIFSLDNEETMELTKFTKGYAFAYQLLGNVLYESKDKKLTEAIISEFDELIYDRAYSIIYSELSNAEKDIIKAAVIDPSNERVMKAAHISSSQLSIYKKRLCLKGILVSGKERVVFALPRFKEIVTLMISFED